MCPPPPGLLPSAESPLNPGLREVGVDLNVATDDFNASTPAHLAAAKGYVNVLQALHEARASMSRTDRSLKLKLGLKG